MLLESLDGSRVELTVAGYEFRLSKLTDPPDWWDANWLLIRGRIHHGGVSWEFVRPCLTTRETRELGDWLRAVARSAPVERRLWFTEPNLEFSHRESLDDTVSIIASFTMECLPVPVPKTDESEDVVLTLPRAALLEAVASWEQELAAFPPR